MAIVVQVRKDKYNSTAGVDKALKKLKREMVSSGILKELKDRQYFEKPSVKKRKKAAAARSRVAKENKMKDKGIM